MQRLNRLAAVAAVAIVVAGCAVQPKYTWGNYDGSLYRYYKDPATADEHVAELHAIIEAAAQSQRKVAPGIHAEYGYFLLQKGQADAARVQFEQEKAAWPESAQLMNTMIGLAGAKSSAPTKEQTK